MMKVALTWILLICSALVITLPGIGSWLESSLLLHVLVQLPLLVFLGWLAGGALPAEWVRRINTFNTAGIVGVLMMSFSGLFWMLPSALDASLQITGYAVMKGISLFLFIGVVLSITNKVINPIMRGVFLLEGWAMLGRLGSIYKVSPERLCNSYLLNEQQQLGAILIFIAIVIAVFWACKVLFGNHFFTHKLFFSSS
jgi:hypothetical protein